ncbi:MAG: hypothetical protein KGJ57_17420 [Sphingomonadales bacterium]|nr:hypothetical protein [Sphingomonadales bacterium]MDE2171178.1 hypothetical protein [Sphingomonadales bacterium]
MAITTADTVNSWFRERLATGAIARSTEAYNQAVAALPDLIARLTPADPAPAPAGKAKASDSSTPPDPATGNKG